MKDGPLAFLLGAILLFNAADILEDLTAGVEITHFYMELAMAVLSAFAMLYLLYTLHQKKNDLLRIQLSNSDKQLNNISEQMRTARHDYSTIIGQQFNTWKLTRSEQDVAMLMLKGLSFKEIAAVRNTQEKTVRQQASNIYSKAEVEGRHEFAGWFIEDFLSESRSI